VIVYGVDIPPPSPRGYITQRIIGRFIKEGKKAGRIASI